MLLSDCTEIFYTTHVSTLLSFSFREYVTLESSVAQILKKI